MSKEAKQSAKSPQNTSLDDPAQFYTEAPLGIVYAPERTLFRTFAPTATAASVVLYNNPTGVTGKRVEPMQLVGKGVWETALAGDLEGLFYTYLFEGHVVKPQAEVVDIYAINTVNSTSRARITDLSRTDPEDWDKLKAGPPLSAPPDAVIYELHIRDLTMDPESGVQGRGKYLGWTEAGTRLGGEGDIKTALDHIEELGATHVQILPVQDFEYDEYEAPYFWGYMTNAFNSPEGMYASDPSDESRIRELKSLVAALHARGIGVVLDVVYNHVGAGATFDDHVPSYYFRHFPDGKLSDGSGCGNDFRSEAPMARKFIVDSLLFWMDEYGVDGFRFDLMALIDLDTMIAVESALRAVRPDILIYGEPWSAGHSHIDGRWTDKGALAETAQLGAFNDDFRNVLKGSPSGEEKGFIQNGYFRDTVFEGIKGQPNWVPTPCQTINYMTCHDNLTLWDKLVHTSPDAPEEEITLSVKLGYLLLLVAQGVPFIHGGCEFGRTKDGDENSYISPDETNRIDWHLKRKNFDLFTYVRDLIALRKAHPLFRLRTRAGVQSRLAFFHHDWHDLIIFTIDGRGLEGETWDHACIVINGSPETTAQVQLPVGEWHTAFAAAAEPETLSGEVSIPHRTGMILCQTMH